MSEEEEKCDQCGGSGKVGTAISTRGPVDIFCLNCLGTGIIKKEKIERSGPKRAAFFYFINLDFLKIVCYCIRKYIENRVGTK